jgi:hypothetical protein
MAAGGRDLNLLLVRSSKRGTNYKEGKTNGI